MTENQAPEGGERAASESLVAIRVVINDLACVIEDAGKDAALDPRIKRARAALDALAAPAPQATDAELERRTGEPHVDGWPLVSGLPVPQDSLDSAQPSKGVAMQAPQALPVMVMGAIYQSSTHGPVEFVGLDVFHGQTTYQFQTQYGTTYILPDQLASFLSAPQTKESKA